MAEKNIGVSNLEVSVIIPVHNRAGIIPSAIRSALNQTIKPKEIIVVDDASTDKLSEKIEHFDKNTVKLIRLNNKTNAAYARNYGALSSESDYIAFLDSDDFWEKNHIESKLKIINKDQNIKGVYGSFYVMDNQRVLYIKKPTQYDKIIHPAEYVLRGSGIRTSTFLFNRKAFLTIKFNDNLTKHQDWDLFIRFVSKHNMRVDHNPTVKIYVSGVDRMSQKPDHTATKYFLNKYSNHLTTKTKEKICANFAMLTCQHEGKTDNYYWYYEQINWFVPSSFRVISIKILLLLPFAPSIVNSIKDLKKYFIGIKRFFK